jgi:hypothetical protein
MFLEPKIKFRNLICTSDLPVSLVPLIPSSIVPRLLTPFFFPRRNHPRCILRPCPRYPPLTRLVNPLLMVSHLQRSLLFHVFEDTARNEVTRRSGFDTVWSNMGLVSSTYVNSVSALNIEHSSIFEINIGASLV